MQQPPATPAHPPAPCPPARLTLQPYGALELADIDGHILWSNGINDAAAGPYTLTSTAGTLTETDAAGAKVWEVPAGPAPAGPPPPLPPLTKTFGALSTSAATPFPSNISTEGGAARGRGPARRLCAAVPPADSGRAARRARRSRPPARPSPPQTAAATR